MKPIVSTVEVVRGCGGCPADWEVTDHLGRPVYIRYRYGALRVDLTAEPDRPPKTIMHLQHGDPYAGVMDERTMVTLTAPALTWVTHRIHFKPKP